MRLDNIDAFRRPIGTTVNDAVLAICGGALRRYLSHHSAVPRTPLQALVPVSTGDGRDANAGNHLSAFVTTLGTHLDDPVR